MNYIIAATPQCTPIFQCSLSC